MALRFLNKATFGATSKDIEHLQKIGVPAWLEEQFALPKNKDIYLKKTIELAKAAEPSTFPASVDKYLANNDTVFYMGIDFNMLRYFLSSWFEAVLLSKDQLRHKTAYALSQIVVESIFEPLFRIRAEALAHHYDILYNNAFGSYSQLLQDVSFSPGMGVFLTYNGNRKLYKNEAGIPVYPDENYAREIMQLFSIGLNKLHMDGTPVLDDKERMVPTYTQHDVNELARVFTGWDLRRNTKFGLVFNKQGDFTHPMEMTPKYHDFGQKNILEQTIAADMDPYEEVKEAIKIIMSQPSAAPYLSKTLIMRLTKSNPSPDYVKRVATVFQNTHGNLEEVVKAIFLDPELWEDLKEDRIVKFKEPLVAYTQLLRSMHVKPMPKWYMCSQQRPADAHYSNCQVIRNRMIVNDPRSYLAQGPGLAPSVFNFYDNDFVPNDEEFKRRGFKAPEVQIQTDSMLIHFSNKIRDMLFESEKEYIQESFYKGKDRKWHRYGTLDNYLQKAYEANNPRLFRVGWDKFLIDADEEYKVLEKVLDGDTNGDFANLQDFRKRDFHKDEEALRALIDFEDRKLTGGLLSEEQKEVLFDGLKERIYIETNDVDHGGRQSKKYQLFRHIIAPVIRAIVTSEKYMVE